ncbi:hypothetical protein AGMMS49944_19150 [Spirochaetia bacterium]|nr:hypothetical protein AGMMS49944_19150 [Spirochaetia bacterium]
MGYVSFFDNNINIPILVINAIIPPTIKGIDCPIKSHKTPAIIEAGNSPNPTIAECKPSELAFCVSGTISTIRARSIPVVNAV